MFDEDAISRIRGSCDYDVEVWMTKIVVKEIKDYEVGRLFFDVYRYLAEPDNEADRSRSTW